MSWFSDLSTRAKAVLAGIVMLASVITALQVAEPYTPALRGWVREYFEDSRAVIKTELDKQIEAIRASTEATIAKMNHKLELIDQGQIENRLVTLDVLLAGLRAQLTEAKLRENEDPMDTFLINQREQIEAQIHRTEIQRSDLQCLLDRKRGNERRCQ